MTEIEKNLQDLEALLKAGTITADDYNQLKNDLLGSIEKEKKEEKPITSSTVKGEAIKSDYLQIGFKYDRAMFNDTESYGTLEELAALLEKYPDIGEKRLYGESIIAWLFKSGNTIVDDIKQIRDAHYNDRQSGLYKAIYTLDPSRPFISNGIKKCYNTVEIADALISEFDYYKKDLKNRNARLYQYIETAGGIHGKMIADQFHKYFRIYSQERALRLCYLKLQEDGGRSITLGSKTYIDTEAAAEETDSKMQNLIKNALMERDSLFNVWLSDHYGDRYAPDGLLNIDSSSKSFILSKFTFIK